MPCPLRTQRSCTSFNIVCCCAAALPQTQCRCDLGINQQRADIITAKLRVRTARDDCEARSQAWLTGIDLSKEPWAGRLPRFRAIGQEEQAKDCEGREQKLGHRSIIPGRPGTAAGSEPGLRRSGRGGGADPWSELAGREPRRGPDGLPARVEEECEGCGGWGGGGPGGAARGAGAGREARGRRVRVGSPSRAALRTLHCTPPSTWPALALHPALHPACTRPPQPGVPAARKAPPPVRHTLGGAAGPGAACRVSAVCTGH